MAEHLGLSVQVFRSGVIELAMVILTMLLLDVPNFFLPFRSENTQGVLRSTGLIMLCLTFCWSFIFGCVLALNAGTYRL